MGGKLVQNSGSLSHLEKQIASFNYVFSMTGLIHIPQENYF